MCKDTYKLVKSKLIRSYSIGVILCDHCFSVSPYCIDCDTENKYKIMKNKYDNVIGICDDEECMKQYNDFSIVESDDKDYNEFISIFYSTDSFTIITFNKK